MSTLSGHATLAIDGKVFGFPSPTASAALRTLVDQSVIQTETVGSERIELSFSNGAVLSFTFDPVAGWRPVWDGDPLPANVIALGERRRIPPRRYHA